MRLIGGALLIALGAIGCGDDDTDDEPQERVAVIEGRQEFAQLSGESSVRWTEGTTGFSATIDIQNDEPGAVRPWHVHFGTCETGGAIVGSDGDYARLQVGADGTAFVSEFVPAPLTVGEQYHVNVHLSEEEMDTIIACGDLDDEVEPI